MSGAFCCIAMARIKLKNSQVKDKAPLATDLDVGGEIAVNHHADNPGIFLKDTAGAVRKIAGPGSISTSAATEAAAGIVELATLAETATGTDVTRAVHPAGLKALLRATLTPGSATAPAGPATGATYVDSSVSPAVVAVWDGAAWVKQVGTATASATAPTTPVRGQVYLDTSTRPAVSKLWNGTAWIDLTTDTAVQSKLDAQLGGIWTRTGTVLSPATAGDVVNISAGTAALPGLTPVGDPNTGIYSPGADQLAISTGGSPRVTVTSTGLAIGATTAGATLDVKAAAATTPLIVQGPSSEFLRCDQQGRLLVGTSTARSNLPFAFGNAAARLQVEGAGEGQGSFAVIQNFDSATAGVPAVFNLARSGAASVGSNTAIASGNQLGEMQFSGSDGTSFIRAASIRGEVDGTPGTNDMPGRLVFSTTADGASSPTERFRITNNGVIAHDQPAPAAVNATATLTIANLKAGIITSTSAVATDMTLPTGTDTQAGFSGTYDNFTFEWSVINTGPSLVRVLAGTAHTIVGSGSVATGTSGRFASRRTAANTFVSYRLS